MLETIPFFLLVFVFLLATGLIGIFGVRITHIARRLAADTGMGEAIMGAFFVGATTSLSGIIASVTAASYGHAELAVSNALGGIAAQTFFLAVADMFYRKANLEHAAASAENLMMCAFLITLLTINLIAFAVPNLQVLSIHPVSLLLFIAYLFGMRLIAKTHKSPMWLPKRTSETRTDNNKKRRKTYRFDYRRWLFFSIYSIIVGISGWIVSMASIEIVARTGLTEGLVGGLFTAVSTSLPELVIAVTAVRMKSLTLAVGDIIGGNSFDTLFIAASDAAYRPGSIYANVTSIEQFWLAITLMMNCIILMGLLHRQRHGVANIGWESMMIFIIYLGGLVYVAH